MSLRDVGSYIGHNRVTTTSQGSASGIWSLAAAERRRRADAWPGGFLPSTITGLQLWLDASDASTLYDATSGGSLVAADGGVARWEDKSGNARHFTQSNSTSRPLRRASGRNGLGTVEFDGSDDVLIGDSTQYVQTAAPFTAVFVHIVQSDSGAFPVLMESKTNQTQNFFWINSNYTEGGNYTDYAQGSNQNFETTRYTSAARGSWRYVLFDFSGSSPASTSSYSARANKSGLTRDTAGNFAPKSGATSALGAISDGSQPLKGSLAEVIIYSSVLQSQDRDALETYLSEKWGIT